MRCPVCQGWVGLQATACACGFDLSTGEVANAMAHARRDLRSARKLELVGLAGAAVFAAVCTLPSLVPEDSLAGSFIAAAVASASGRTVAIFVMLPLVTAIYGLGRGTWMRRDARRRLGVADRMRQPPPARVVRDRERPG